MCGMNFRNLRVGKLIREEISKIILRELEFPGTLITVTNVLVDEKLNTAKIQVSILPASPKSSAAGVPTTEKKTLKILRANQGKLQRLLSYKLNIKPMPRIQFESDPGPQNAAQVEKILLENKNGSG